MSGINELITKRWSPLAFDSREVEFEDIQLLFEAARWAPSSRNSQPWRFVFATSGTRDYMDLLELLDEENRVWASTAPLLVLSMAQVVSTYKNRPNRLALYETGMAVGNLLLQATHLGLFVHQMSGFNLEGIKEKLVIPSRYEPAALMAIGYRGDPSALPSELREREKRDRSRMEISKFLISGKCK